MELDKLNETLKRKKITLTFDRELVNFIANASFSLTAGARAIKKQLQELIENPLAQAILADEIKTGSTVHLIVKNGIIKLS